MHSTSNGRHHLCACRLQLNAQTAMLDERNPVLRKRHQMQLRSATRLSCLPMPVDRRVRCKQRSGCPNSTCIPTGGPKSVEAAGSRTKLAAAPAAYTRVGLSIVISTRCHSWSASGFSFTGGSGNPKLLGSHGEGTLGRNRPAGSRAAGSSSALLLITRATRSDGSVAPSQRPSTTPGIVGALADRSVVQRL